MDDQMTQESCPPVHFGDHELVQFSTSWGSVTRFDTETAAGDMSCKVRFRVTSENLNPSLPLREAFFSLT